MSRIRIRTMSIVAAVLVSVTALGSVAPAASAAPKAPEGDSPRHSVGHLSTEPCARPRPGRRRAQAFPAGVPRPTQSSGIWWVGSVSASSSSTRHARQKPVAERRQVDAAAYDLGEADRVHRGQHVGLRLDHLVLHRVLELLAGEPDQAEPEQVVEVRRHLVEVAAAGPRADHRHPRRDQRRADHADRPAGADVDRRLRPAAQEQQQDAGLVGGQLLEDPGVRRVRLLVAPDVARAVEQVLAALAQRLLASSSPGRRARPASHHRARARAVGVAHRLRDRVRRPRRPGPRR